MLTCVLDGTLHIQNKKKKKYKKKPPKPARPKPGQVIIATAADGTPIYCCPECSMAYPDKGQLEMHLSVHKIERRFICGICGAGSVFFGFYQKFVNLSLLLVMFRFLEIIYLFLRPSWLSDTEDDCKCDGYGFDFLMEE